MTHQLKRAVADLIGIPLRLNFTQAIRWYLAILRNLPSVLRTRKFYLVDAAIKGEVVFRYHGRKFRFVLDDPRHFSWLREFFIRDVYLGPFDASKIAYSNSLDLGCNVGRVSDILRTLGGPNAVVIGVDAEDFSNLEGRRSILRKWKIEFICALVLNSEKSLSDTSAKYEQFIKAKVGAGFNANKQTITPEEIIARFPDGRIDFMKVDIEGAEFSLVSSHALWLQRVSNISMEVHKEVGNPRKITEALADLGFSVVWLDPYSLPCRPEDAQYIYASRTGALRPV